jgi:hypothetical protein
MKHDIRNTTYEIRYTTYEIRLINLIK